MSEDASAHKAKGRFQFTPSPKGMSKIHEDLATSQPQPGQQSSNSDPTMLKRTLPQGRKLRVGIVGGGVAGLRCADILLRHNVEVTILEARNRLGGRLGQATLKGGYLADLGPNWIHGTENNPMMDLAAETGTTVVNWGEKEAVVDSDKSVLPLKLIRELGEFGWSTIAAAFKESNARFASTSKEEPIPTDKSLADAFEEKIKAVYGSPDSPETADKIALLRRYYKFWGPFVGQPIEKQSLKFFWLEECLEGENLLCADSYFKILRRIASPAEEGAKILFDCEVTRIRTQSVTSGDRSLPRLAHRPREHEVPDKGGKEQLIGPEAEELFDEVIVTTPLGWLKQHLEAFEPPLPNRMQSAIRDLGYGTLDKAYITFPTAWWNKPLAPDAATRPVEAQQTTPNVTATTSAVHQGPTAETTSDRLLKEDPNYPGFTSFLHPEYAKDTNTTMQNQEICNLAALPGKTAQPTLLFYFYGDFGRRIAEVVLSLPPRGLNEPSSEAYIHALWPFFEPYVSQLPDYDPKSPDCHPTDLLATAWVIDDLAGNGSYTNFPTGLERGDEDVLTIRHGLPDSGLWFAGEHTAPFVALGTVTGAYWSGEAVARRILSMYGIEGEGVEGTKEQHLKA